MQQYRDNSNHLITDAYIRLEYVRSLTDLYGILDNETLKTNVTDLKQFVADLEEQEEKSPRNKDTSAIYGVVLSFLLDLESNNDKNLMLQLVERITTEQYPGLPFYSYVTKKGKAVFVNVYLCEREYSPQGIKTTIRATKDLYRDSETGKACSQDHANAVLYKRSGEVIRQSESKFTSKKNYFRYATEKQFTAAMTRLKAWYIRTYEKIAAVVLKVTISFKKFILNKTNRKAVAKIFNKALADMETMYRQRYTMLEELSDERDGQISRDKKRDLETIYKEVDGKIRSAASFTYKKRVTFSLDLDESKEKASETAELLKDYFMERLQTVTY